MLKVYIERYIAELYAAGCSFKTVDDYTNKLRKFCVYLNTHVEDKPCRISDIDLNVLFSYVVWLRTKNKNTVTVQSYVRSLRAFLNWLYTSGYIADDLCKRFKLPKARKSFVDVLTDEEINKLYSAFSSDSFYSLRNKCIISLMLDSGLRLGEIVAVELSKLHLNDGYLIVTGKGDKQRAVSFGFVSRSLLYPYLSRAPTSEMLFVHDDGTPISENTIKNIFRRLKKTTGIRRLHPHLLRHTFATRFLENGGNIYDLKDMLGHTTLKQVQTYLHMANTRIIKGYSSYSPLDNIKKPIR